MVLRNHSKFRGTIKYAESVPFAFALTLFHLIPSSILLQVKFIGGESRKQHHTDEPTPSVLTVSYYSTSPEQVYLSA